MLTKETILSAIHDCAYDGNTARLEDVSQKLGISDNLKLMPIYKALQENGDVKMTLNTITIIKKF